MEFHTHFITSSIPVSDVHIFFEDEGECEEHSVPEYLTWSYFLVCSNLNSSAFTKVTIETALSLVQLAPILRGLRGECIAMW